MAEKPTHSFWTSLPGFLTALAALISAVGGTIGGLAYTSAGPFSHQSRAAVSDNSTNPAPRPPPPATGLAAIDPCVVGTWRAVSERIDTNVTTLGGSVFVTLNGSGGALLTIRSDGAALWDYSSDSPLLGTIRGAAGTFPAVLSQRGIVTARVTSVSKGIFHKSDVVPGYTWQWTVDQQQFSPQKTPWSPDSRYKCSDTHLTFDNGATTWQRL